MYIQHYRRKKKSGEYQTTYIAESYREDGQVKRRHLANLSNLPEGLKASICKTVYDFQNNHINLEDLQPLQGKSCGALLAFKQLAEQTGILHALGKDRKSKLALFQIIARIVVQQSRHYAANEWAPTQAIKEVLDLNYFTEDDLYDNLDWLSQQQENIEKKLFNFRHKNKAVRSLYLYDVTSSYLEGSQNELAAYGYNRDKKQGKMQIVIGLLCCDKGFPVSVEVFDGNTSDSTIVHQQVQKLAHRFKAKQVVLVGDRGMIKSTGIDALNEWNWQYITAITKPQIQQMLDKKTIQLEMFTQELIEVEIDQVRYILHKNPHRAIEISENRNQKLQKIELCIANKNQYIEEHPKSKLETALKSVREKITKLKANTWVEAYLQDGKISLRINEESLAKLALLDGCYIIKSNVAPNELDTKQVHQKYKDLAMVEQAFRTCKQSIEEIRPIYVRKASRTKGHVLVCMLAYILVKEMEIRCHELNMSRKGIIDELNQIQYILYQEQKLEIKKIPQLRPESQRIIDALKIKLPSYL